MIKKGSDPRFYYITDCKIVSLYKKVPHQFGGFVIEIRYKKNDDDLLSETRWLEIDQSKLIDEITEFFDGKHERLYYTDGMGDIDIFKQNDKYVVYYSPNSGLSIYHYFSEEEFIKLKQWAELEKKPK